MCKAAAFVALVTGLLAFHVWDGSLEARQAIDRGSVTTGEASNIRPVEGVPPSCSQPANVQPDVFPIRVGTYTSDDGKEWVVPGPFNETGAVATDMYNDCMSTGDNPNYLSEVETVVIDPDGVEITGYIMADNYFELWVNGTFVARDSTPMTPFNSSVVRFRANYPMTYAMMGIDWETHNGVGMEYDRYAIGDAGMMAYFSDGNGTSADWKADVFYIAPLDNPDCVRVTADGRDSSFCQQARRPICAANDPMTCKALHFERPSDWTSPAFNDASWPNAVIWQPWEVTGTTAYVDYVDRFGDAEFIWTPSLRLDNLVLARYTAEGPR